MKKLCVGVVANRKKVLGGGLPELRAVLAAAGVTDPLWYEVSRSKEAPRKIRRCIEGGAELVLAWGGDGMVQRCLHALVEAGAQIPLAILPAGTANLLATNLGIEKDLRAAVEVALSGQHRRLDVGRIGDEHFAVMAGTGFDALMIRDANSHDRKDRFGRAAYIWTGLKHLRGRRTQARVSLDGAPWFEGQASCVLIGNVGTILGGVQIFPDAQPDDGVLEVGVVTAAGLWGWLRVLSRTLVGQAAQSPLVHTAQARRIDIELVRPRPYQLDGGDRPRVKRLSIAVLPRAVTVCVPQPRADAEPAA